jgi:hypothetical protein
MIVPCNRPKIEAFYIFYEYNIGAILCFSDIYSQMHLISCHDVITGVGDEGTAGRLQKTAAAGRNRTGMKRPK